MSLFSISNNLRAIYQQIEDNGGEITEEIDEALAINEQGFRDKIQDYVSLVSNLSADVDQCSAEIKRIQQLKKIKENTIEHLKSVMAKAINEFGDRTKSGSSFVDFGIMKVSTRKSESTEVNDDYIKELGNRITKYMIGLSENGMLLDSSPYRDREFIDNNKLTDYDLYPMNVEITFKTDALSLIRGVCDSKVKNLFDSQNKNEIEVSVSVDKKQAKDMIKVGEPLTVAKLKQNNSIVIK